MDRPAGPPPPDWERIDTVLLDLDGTLLDQAFDNHVWLERVPAAYAALRGLTPPQAYAALVPRFQAVQGTLAWYSMAHWTRELGVDIVDLHRQEAGRIAWLPGARNFLARVRALGKRLVLLTNADPAGLQLKEEYAGLAGHFDAVHSSHELGTPKEEPLFWARIRELEPFDPNRTLFVDDTPGVLQAARAAGIRWVYAVRRPDLAGGAGAYAAFPGVRRVEELLPGPN